MAELPTGTVSFLFTDLEGSTRLWEEHPERCMPRWRGMTRSCATRSNAAAAASAPPAHGVNVCQERKASTNRAAVCRLEQPPLIGELDDARVSWVGLPVGC